MSAELTDNTPSSAISRPDPRNLTSLPQILSSLSEFQSKETELSNSLTKLLAASEPITSSLSRLQSLAPHIDQLLKGAFTLSLNVCSTAKTAERIGGRVQSLDEEMRRIREAGDRVGQVIELKSSLVALQLSMESGDWESAARHCARAMSLPSEVIAGSFAEFAVPTSDSHLPPAQTLQEAREHLLHVFRTNFEQASRSRDSTATSRFFKLFPAIGWEKEGLQAYATFVVDSVRVRAPTSAKTSSPLYFITALTSLFESIAMIVDQHQPVVEKYYGTGKMKAVAERLLNECDRVVKDVMNRWQEERSIARKLSDVMNNPPIFSLAAVGRRQQSSLNQDDEPVDPREIDQVIIEMSGMVGRWNLFKKFLLDSFEAPEPASASLPLESTASQLVFDQILARYYIPLEVWYVRAIINKAHRLSQPDSTQPATTTTTPDDVFYILKVVLLRLLSTGSLNAVERMVEQLRDVLEKDYAGILKKKLDDVYRSTGTSGQIVRGEKADRENRLAFAVILNDLDVSSSHLERLLRDVSSNGAINQYFLSSQQQVVRNDLFSLSSLVTKFRSTSRVGVEQLFNQLIRPKLRTFILEVYKDVSYVLDDDSYSNAEYQDLVRKRFMKFWDALMDDYKDTFTDANFRLLFGLVLDNLLRPWERFMMGFKFTELGAIRFDRDLRSVNTYLSSQTAFGDGREKFVRLQQMSTLLNLDSEEDVDEFYNGSGITWKLSSQEARAVAALKI
ncbi:COG4 transport protein-domain-containing protein [Lentinula aciculospora]|uniref:Conserved oligomeric Golgi complex subunit 4 n=1 Tax=Lentinula aciculospora TaxID=153920 RepID=A0A9W9ATJ1_9AGAR|nr:COG4 transport protein-domain-containing protein [Lentinula aciculospora]